MSNTYIISELNENDRYADDFQTSGTDSVESIMEVLETGIPDRRQRSRTEWIEIIDRYDGIYDIIEEIAKNRKNPAFKELVYILESAIDAELYDDQRRV